MGWSEATEAEDIQTIVSCLGLSETSAELQRITGLETTVLLQILSGGRRRDTAARAHVAVVAALIHRLAEGRAASTRTGQRQHTSLIWLHTAPVATSKGINTPLEVLSDPDLAREVLDGLMR
jgi:hypothetical protein